MDFSSIFFIWVYLPLTLILIYAVAVIFRNKKSTLIQISNGLLLLLSIWFYSWAGIRSVVLMLCLVCADYIFGLWIFRTPPERGRKRALVLSVCANILILAIFKYGNMCLAIVENMMAAGSGSKREALHNMLSLERTGSIGIEDIVLPLAISFVVFQSISYLVDVYKEKTEPSSNIFEFVLYELLFFQLVQGPIVRFGDMQPQIRDRELTSDRTYEGVRRFCQGLGKKVLIANTVAPVVDFLWGEDLSTIGTVDAWIGILLYAFQIYYDFSGYSDMAVGLGKMTGFDICENFNHPYMSESAQEFWRRWHISLSIWFKDYIYIPLGGNRKGQARTLFNIFVVFLVTGIWHGANWTFIFWGIWFAVVQIIERLFLSKWLKNGKMRAVKKLYAFFIVLMGWVLFRAPDVFAAKDYYAALFSFRERVSDYGWYTYTDYKTGLAIIAAILFMGILGRYSEKYRRFTQQRSGAVVDFALHMLILIIAVLQIVNGSYNPSIYARF